MSGQWQQIADGLWRRTSGRCGAQQPVTTYLWRRGETFTLIDPAADVTGESVREVGHAAVSEILITHFQRENVEGAVNFPDAALRVPAGDEYLAAGEQAYRAEARQWEEPWDWETRGDFRGDVAAALNERPTREPVRLADPLRPGEQGEDFRILATPGHGKHAVTILANIADQAVGFCGDVIHGDGQLWNWFDSEWDYGLQRGQRTLLESARRLADQPLDLLCPTHGPVVGDPKTALGRLASRLAAILDATGDPAPTQEDQPSPAPGFRQILPSVHQYRDGNCAVLVSHRKLGLLFDDGPCCWKPMPERIEYHRRLMAEMKRALDLEKIDTVIPTHYHGDHVEMIPDLVATEKSRVVCLDLVADVLEHPNDYGVMCPLPWYGTGNDTVPIHQRASDNARLGWCEYDIEFTHVGGQTYYHAAMLAQVDGRRVAFIGDAVGLGSTAPDPVLCYNDGEPGGRGWAYAARQVRRARPDVIVGGHGAYLYDPLPFLDAKIANWDRQLQRFDQINARPRRTLFFSPFV